MLCSNAEGASLRGCNFEDPSGLKANLEGNGLNPGSWLETVSLCCLSLILFFFKLLVVFSLPSTCLSSGANLKGVDMEDSQMTGINLRVATLKNAKLKNCNLRGATLAGTDLEVSRQGILGC